MPPSPRIPQPRIISRLPGSGSGSGGTAFGGTGFGGVALGGITNPAPLSEIKPESKVEISERTANSGSPGHAPLTLKSKPAPLVVVARLYGFATGKRWLKFHWFAEPLGKLTEYGIESPIAGAASSRHNNVTRDMQPNCDFMSLLPTR